MPSIRILSALLAITLCASGCATLSPRPIQPIATESFKRSLYRAFPVPPIMPVDRENFVLFWCLNRPQYVAPAPLCAAIMADEARADGTI